MPALDEVDRFYSGLLGYNIVLTALALDELIELDLFSIRQLLIIFLYLTLSLLLSKIGFIIADIGIIPALTAPFVIATWLILAYEKRKNKATA
jgi:urea transporter